jgi:hypothetical protein
LTAPSSGGPGSQPRQQHENRSGSNPGADSEEKREPVSDIDIAVADSLKVLDLKRPIREATKFCIAAKCRDGPNPSRFANALIDAGSHGPIQEVERQKLEHGNNKRSDGFPKIMLVQADASVQHLYNSRQRAQDL